MRILLAEDEKDQKGSVPAATESQAKPQAEAPVFVQATTVFSFIF